MYSSRAAGPARTGPAAENRTPAKRISLRKDHTGDMCRRYADFMEMTRRSPRTIGNRQSVLRLLAAWLGAAPENATAAELHHWRESINHFKPDSIRTYVAHVKMFYAWLQDQEYRPDNPAAGLPAPPLQPGIPKPISETELMAAVAAAPARIRPWLVLAGWCGLRAKEIAYLRRENVRLDAVPPVIVIAADATKGQRGRTIPLPPYVVAELGPVLPSGGWVFGRRDGRDGPNFPHQVSHLVNQYLHEQGVAGTLHGGRHRYGTQLYRSTKDIRLVQEMLGHQSPVTTAGYTKVEMSEAMTAVAALPVPA